MKIVPREVALAIVIMMLATLGGSYIGTRMKRAMDHAHEHQCSCCVEYPEQEGASE